MSLPGSLPAGGGVRAPVTVVTSRQIRAKKSASAAPRGDGGQPEVWRQFVVLEDPTSTTFAIPLAVTARSVRPGVAA